MDDQQTAANAEEELVITEEVTIITEEVSNVTQERRVEDAGPSGTTNLPGAIQSPRPKHGQKAGLSKSDHCIRQIITTTDVTNALKSLSFGAPNQKIPTLDNQIENKALDSTTLLDLKKFMISCFKLNKETPVVVSEIPLEAVHAEIPNFSCNVETECAPIPNLPNEVIVTGALEPKISKSDKKKVGNLSERSDLALAQRDSLSSIGSNVCRICMTRGRERLISPCNCKGSLANVHLSCLERWLNQVGRNHCELCGFSYPAIRTPRYTVLQALRLWFGNPRNRSHLQSDCLIFWLLSTVTAGLLAVCIVGTQYFVIEGNKFGKPEGPARKEEGFRFPSRLHDSLITSISHRITETAMDFFMAIVLCGYSVTVYLLWKDHYVMWNRWRRANVNVRLLLAPDTNPVPFAPRPGYNVI